jgi:DNA mismatch endonuclease (patch repair protein)
LIDVVDPATRSRMMSEIRSTNTRPEIKVRKALHALGFRFARISFGLPGTPDVVLPHWTFAVLLHGCCWHWNGCQLSKLPASNEEFWFTKLSANRVRDAHVLSQLQERVGAS